MLTVVITIAQAWTAPTTTPPGTPITNINGDNTEAPIDVGGPYFHLGNLLPNIQTKIGGLSVGPLSVTGKSDLYGVASILAVPSKPIWVSNIGIGGIVGGGHYIYPLPGSTQPNNLSTSGNVGIGIGTSYSNPPTEKLDVGGKVNVSKFAYVSPAVPADTAQVSFPNFSNFQPAYSNPLNSIKDPTTGNFLPARLCADLKGKVSPCPKGNITFDPNSYTGHPSNCTGGSCTWTVPDGVFHIWVVISGYDAASGPTFDLYKVTDRTTPIELDVLPGTTFTMYKMIPGLPYINFIKISW